MPDQRITAHDEDDTLILNYYQDLEPSLQYAADARRAESENSTRKSEFRHVMRVEPNVIMAVCKQLGIPAGDLLGNPDYSKRVFAELKRLDYKNFRTVSDKRL